MNCRVCGRKIKQTAEWCPYCGEYTEKGAVAYEQEQEQESVEREQRNRQEQDKSKQEAVRDKTNLLFYICVVGFVVAILFFFWYGILMSQDHSDKVSKNDVNKVEQAIEKKSIFHVATLEQSKEMMISFNGVVGDNNPDLYRGIRINGRANQGQIILEVSQNWYYLPKGVKEEFLKNCSMLWVGMLGARKIEVDANKITFAVRREDSQEDLATWDSFWGPSIKK